MTFVPSRTTCTPRRGRARPRAGRGKSQHGVVSAVRRGVPFPPEVAIQRTPASVGANRSSGPTLSRLALAGGSIMARCFGSLFGHRFEFSSSPSSCSFHVRNRTRRHRRQHRGDDRFTLVSLRNDHEVGIASREVKAHKLAAGTLNQLADRRLSVSGALTKALA